jgi:NADPH:quinone reductase-like Zn-dependent oxidoreductase
VLVRVSAAGINPIDGKLRAGFMKEMLPVSLPWIPGVDFSGTVDSVGIGVTSVAAGDEVFGKSDLPRNGSYAEFIAVPALSLVRKPGSVGYVEAAAIPGAALTAWQAMFGSGSLELVSGQTILVLGAAGGVGSFAVQLAKWKGARVVAAGRSGQEAHLRALGADAVVDTDGELSLAVRADAVLDLVGGELQQRAWRHVKRGGAFASTMGPPSAEEAAGRAARTIAVFARTDAEQLGEIAALVQQKAVRVFVTRTLSLANASEAHELLEAHGVVGKIVLTVP